MGVLNHRDVSQRDRLANRLKQSVPLGNVPVVSMVLVLWVTFLLVPKEVSASSSDVKKSASVPDYPQRIVSINLCTDELLLRLADRKQIAAVTPYAKDASISTVFEKAEGLETVQAAVENVLSLDPDLVLATRFNERKTIEALRRLGLNVVLLPLPKDFEGLHQNIRLVAKAVGHLDRGEALIQKMNTDLLKFRTAGSPSKALFFEIGSMTAGRDTFENALIEASGAVNLAAQMGIEGHSMMSFERLLMEKPDLVILSDTHQKTQTTGKEILFHPALRKNSNMQVMTVPSCLLNCGTPESVKVVEQISKRLANLA